MKPLKVLPHCLIGALLGRSYRISKWLSAKEVRSSIAYNAPMMLLTVAKAHAHLRRRTAGSLNFTGRSLQDTNQGAFTTACLGSERTNLPSFSYRWIAGRE